MELEAVIVKRMLCQITPEEWNRSTIYRINKHVELFINNFGDVVQIIARKPGTANEIDLTGYNFIMSSSLTCSDPVAWLSIKNDPKRGVYQFTGLSPNLHSKGHELHLSRYWGKALVSLETFPTQTTSEITAEAKINNIKLNCA